MISPVLIINTAFQIKASNFTQNDVNSAKYTSVDLVDHIRGYLL